MKDRNSLIPYVIGIAVAALLPVVITSEYDIHIFVMVWIFSLLVIGFNFIFLDISASFHWDTGLILRLELTRLLAVGGTLVAALYSGASTQPSVIVRKVVFFPPFVSLVLGSAVGAAGGWPEALDDVLQRIGSTLVPVALFSVGLQLKPEFHREQSAAVALSLTWKLILAPLVVFLAGLAFAVNRVILDIAVLESAMAPIISGAILTSQSRLEPQLANAVLGICILLSLVTVPLANYVLSG